MENIGVKGVKHASRTIFFFLQLIGLMGAVDIYFLENTQTCLGVGHIFSNVDPNVCCTMDPNEGGAVMVLGTSGSTAMSIAYRDGGCTTQITQGSGDICYLIAGNVPHGQLTGATWYGARRRSLLDEHNPQECNEMEPTGVVFVEDEMKGSWVLTSSDAAKMYSQMRNIRDEEKANWFKSPGATYSQYTGLV